MTQPKYTEVKRLLVIKHGALGDLIQGLGAIHDLRLAFPNAQITLLTSPSFKNLMQRCPHIDHILTDARKPYWQLATLWQLRTRLKSAQFDTVVDLQNSSRTNWYRRIFFKHAHWVGRLPSAPKPVSGLKGLAALFSQHQIQVHYLNHPEISWLADSATARLAQLNIAGDYIVLIPGASAAHVEKRWPHYAQLADLFQLRGLNVFAVLGPDEKDLASAFNCPVMTGLNWFELAAVIKDAQFVVGNDTGPCHLASVFQRPGLALFGPSTSALRSELARGPFKTVETTNLADLTPEAVLAMYLSAA